MEAAAAASVLAAKCAGCCRLMPIDVCPLKMCRRHINRKPRVHLPAAVRLHIGHSQQHDAGGGAHPVDGAERGPGLHADRPVRGAHRRPGAGWRHPGHIQGKADCRAFAFSSLFFGVSNSEK